MVALPPTQTVAAVGIAHGGSPAPPPAPPPVASSTQPAPVAVFPPCSTRPDGYIKFLVWVGAQAHEVWAHRTWTAWSLIST
eukprot:7566061-Alexandrium_andersonii.AAC.1